MSGATQTITIELTGDKPDIGLNARRSPKSAYNHIPAQSRESEEDTSSPLSPDPPDPPRSIFRIHCVGQLLLGFYCLAGTGFVSLAITGGVVSDLMYTMMLSMLFLIIISSVVSIIALIHVGSINDHIDSIRFENKSYGQNIGKLKMTRSNLQSENDAMKLENEQLTNHSLDLEEQSKQFSDLVGALEEIADQNGMEFTSLLDQTNGRFQRMEHLIYQNHKTYFLTLFYQNARNLDEQEYQRLLWRMDYRMREGFKRLGPFHTLCEKGKDHIDLERFEEIVEEVLQDPKEVLQQEFVRQYTRAATVGIEYMTERDREELVQEIEQGK